MHYPRTTIGLLGGLAVAALVALRLEGAVGRGCVLGFSLGSVLCAFGTSWQAHWLRRRPARVMQAQVEAFLVKLAVVGGAAVAFRYFEPLTAAADWRSLLLGLAAAVAIGLPLGTYEAARTSRPPDHRDPLGDPAPLGLNRRSVV